VTEESEKKSQLHHVGQPHLFSTFQINLVQNDPVQNNGDGNNEDASA
jgi:hypothetical protein